MSGPNIIAGHPHHPVPTPAPGDRSFRLGLITLDVIGIRATRSLFVATNALSSLLVGALTMKSQLAIALERKDTVDEQMRVQVQIQRRAKELDQGHRPRVCFQYFEAHLVYQMH